MFSTKYIRFILSSTSVKCNLFASIRVAHPLTITSGKLSKWGHVPDKNTSFFILFKSKSWSWDLKVTFPPLQSLKCLISPFLKWTEGSKWDITLVKYPTSLKFLKMCHSFHFNTNYWKSIANSILSICLFFITVTKEKRKFIFTILP